MRPLVGPRTKAIVPVHLFGNVAPVPELSELGVPVLEDAAQAAGASLNGVKAGALGDAATFSFFPSKNLPCIGDGGAIATDSDAVADRARTLRFHGSRDKQTHTDVGYNSRLDSIQAAVLRVLLPELDGWNGRRRAAAEAYERAGHRRAASRRCAPPTGAEHVYHLYVARSERADELAAALGERGIGARGYYRTPAHRQAPMRAFAERRAARHRRAGAHDPRAADGPGAERRAGRPPWSRPAAPGPPRDRLGRGRGPRLLGPEPGAQLRRAARTRASPGSATGTASGSSASARRSAGRGPPARSTSCSPTPISTPW